MINVSDLIIDCQNVDELDRDIIIQKLSTYQFCILRGLIKRKALSEGVNRLKTFIQEEEDQAVTGELPSEVRDYFMKMSIGRGNHSGHAINRGRFMRTIYLPLDADDRFGLQKSFKTVAAVRNTLMNLPIDYAVDDVEDGLWTAARVHHFPAGGGFMDPHRDTLAPQIVKETDDVYEYFQPLLIMSQKGSDFSEGGGVVAVNGQLLEYENFAEFGDIVVYDVNTIHGVNEVDLNRPFHQRSCAGRYSGLVTLYRDMN